MPESPELAVSRDRLKGIIEGRSILSVSPGLTGRYTKKLPEGHEEFSSLLKSNGPAKIEEIGTHGKFMWWRLKIPQTQDAFFLHCTYGMAAQWSGSPSKHTAYVVEYGTAPITRDNRYLHFNDQRHFGTIKFVRGGEAHRRKLATLGPCILSGGLTPEIFAEKMLKKPTRTIAEALMDQSGVAGVGNYIKAECLLRAGISPWRNVTDITSEEYVKLCGSVIDVATESYEAQGASIKTYRNVDGSKGRKQFDFEIYAQKECPKGHPTKREETPEGRTSWWCPRCQT